MKKIILTVAAVFALSFADAQEFKSKRGENFLPVAGEWAIGFDATNFVDFAGGVVGGNGTSPKVDGVNKNALYAFGKYYKTDKIAYRAIANFMFLNNSADKYNQMRVIAGLGKEWRRGSTRLQGYYGVDGLFMFDSGKKVGDADRDKSTLGLGARGFLGCEYFIIPKISIGLEYGFGAMLQSKNSETYINIGGVDTGMAQSSFVNETQVGATPGLVNSTNWGGGHLNITFHF
jgi:hypothetical protein